MNSRNWNWLNHLCVNIELLCLDWYMDDNRGYGVKIAPGGGAIKLKLIKLINSLFVHFITRVSDSTSQGGQSFRPRPQSDLLSLFLRIQKNIITIMPSYHRPCFADKWLRFNHPRTFCDVRGKLVFLTEREHNRAVSFELLYWSGKEKYTMSVSESLRCLIPPVSSGPGLPPLVARARLKMGAGGRSGARSAGRQWSSDSDQERTRVSRERTLTPMCS